MLKKLNRYFSRVEKVIWCVSFVLIVGAFVVFDRSGVVTMLTSLVGVTAILFNAKGNPIGQVLMVVFAIVYSVISFSFRYYGEMITYAGMTLPMAVLALVSWLKNPYKGNKSEVTVNRLSLKEIPIMVLLTAAVTVAFYFILKYFHTANLIPSTVSVTTSFVAAYLTFRRSPYFSLAYAANDVVLIVLWVLAAKTDKSYICVVICFAAFLINDIYCFINWLKMRKKQSFPARQSMKEKSDASS